MYVVNQVVQNCLLMAPRVGVLLEGYKRVPKEPFLEASFRFMENHEQQL